MNSLFLFLLLVLSIFSESVYACSCVASTDDTKEAVSQAYKGAASVVVVQAVSIEKQEIRKAWMDKKDEGIEGEITHFVVVDSWKGEHGEKLSTKTITTPGMCGMSFEQGKAYLLYLYGPDKEGYYSASICSRSIRLEGASEDIKILNTIAPK